MFKDLFVIQEYFSPNSLKKLLERIWWKRLFPGNIVCPVA